MTKTTSWTIGDEGAPAEGLAARLAEELGDCSAQLSEGPFGFGCTRKRRHAGRHLASAMGLGIVAAWPGTHAPALADLDPSMKPNIKEPT